MKCRIYTCNNEAITYFIYDKIITYLEDYIIGYCYNHKEHPNWLETVCNHPGVPFTDETDLMAILL